MLCHRLYFFLINVNPLIVAFLSWNIQQVTQLGWLLCVSPIPIMTQFLETCLGVKLSFILTISLQSSSSYLVTKSLCCSHPAGRVVISFHQRDSGTQGLYTKKPLMDEAMWIVPLKISASEVSGIQNCFCTIITYAAIFVRWADLTRSFFGYFWSNSDHIMKNRAR